MNKEVLIFVVVFFVLITVFFGVQFYFYKIGQNENMERRFEGIVDTVSYDVKGIPTVVLSKKRYYLGMGYNFDHQIENGDYLKKESGSTIYILIKHRTKKIIKFNN